MLLTCAVSPGWQPYALAQWALAGRRRPGGVGFSGSRRVSPQPGGAAEVPGEVSRPLEGPWALSWGAGGAMSRADIPPELTDEAVDSSGSKSSSAARAS